MSKEDVLYAKELIRMVREKVDKLEKLVECFEQKEWPMGPRLLALRPEEIAQCVAMYKRGAGLSLIATRMGYGEQVIKRHLIAAGVEIRGRGSVKRQPSVEQMAARGLS